MKMPFRRSKPLPVRLLTAAAAGAGAARMSLRHRTSKPQLSHQKNKNPLSRIIQRG